MIASRKQSVFAKFGVVALILTMIILYFPPFANAWVGDDYIQFDYIKPFFERPFSAYKLFNPYELTWYYRPLQNLWLLINQFILGYNPLGYYMLLLGLHAIGVSLIYRIARQLGFTYFATFICAFLFAIHGHWVDVITWISSVAIVMSGIVNLLGLSVWISYLKRPSPTKLLLTIFICLTALLTHEEGLMLAPFLLLILVIQRLEMANWRSKKKRTIANLQSLFSKKEVAAFGFLALISCAYLYTELTRENVTIDIGERTMANWLGFLAPVNLQAFFQSTIFRFTFFEPVLTGAGWVQILLLAFVLGLLIFWVWFGNKVARLGLLWTAVHLAFIFWTLWINLPTLYAGRHIYVASIGLVIALGATIDQVTAVSKHTITLKNKSIPVARLIILIIFLLFLGQQIGVAYTTQQSWLANVQEEERTKAQVKALFPSIDATQHFFSYRFPIAPQFTRTVMQLWYDTPLERPGGGLPHLQAYGQATSDFYMLDYENERVYNLMPELQEHAKTIFLWAKPFTDQLLIDDTKQQVPLEMATLKMQLVSDGTTPKLAMSLASPATEGQWLTRAFATNVPANSVLETAVLPSPNTTYRIRITGSNDMTETVFLLANSDETSWQETAVSLNNYWGENALIYLEVMGAGDEENTAVFWANPRLVID